MTSTISPFCFYEYANTRDINVYVIVSVRCGGHSPRDV